MLFRFFVAILTVGFGWIMLTGGGGTKSSKPSPSASVNTNEDGIHLALSQRVKLNKFSCYVEKIMKFIVFMILRLKRSHN